MVNVFDLIRRVQARGGKLTVENGKLRVSAPAALPSELLSELAEYKPEVMIALGAPLARASRSGGACTHETVESVAMRWQSAQVRPPDSRPSACVCCGGPALLNDANRAGPVAAPRCSRCRPSGLVEEASALGPGVRLTIRATGDEAADRAFVATVWELLRERDGENLIFVRLIDASGTVWRVRDRALATPELRRVLARLLADRAQEGS